MVLRRGAIGNEREPGGLRGDETRGVSAGMQAVRRLGAPCRRRGEPAGRRPAPRMVDAVDEVLVEERDVELRV